MKWIIYILIGVLLMSNATALLTREKSPINSVIIKDSVSGAIVLDLKLTTPILNVVQPGNDTLVAQFWLENATILFTRLFDDIDFYDKNKYYSPIYRKFNIKYGIDYNESICSENDYDKRIICYNQTKVNWTSFTNVTQIPKTANKIGMKIGLFTDTKVGENIEWIPAINIFRIAEWASYSVNAVPVLTGYYSNTTSLNDPSSVLYSNGYIYTSSTTGNSLTTFNVLGSNISNPVQVSYYTNATTSSAFDVAVSGNYLYVVSSGWLSTFDINGINASNPVRVSGYNDGRIFGAASIVSKGNYLYLSSSGVLITFDIAGSNASNPGYKNNYTKTGLNGIDLLVQGDYLYETGGNNYSIKTFNIAGSNASNPVEVAHYENSTVLLYAGYMASNGEYLYVSSDNNNVLAVFNITGSNASNPQLITYSVQPSLKSPRQLVVLGSRLYIVSYNSFSLTTFDITGTKSSSPVQIGDYSSSTYLNNPTRISSYDKYIYVTSTTGKSITTFYDQSQELKPLALRFTGTRKIIFTGTNKMVFT